jgi:tRNA-dihydrouridine synthase B
MEFLKENMLFLAPMAKITTLPFRVYCRKFNPDIITCTELISVKSIEYNLKKDDCFSKRLSSLIQQDSVKDRPCGIQLFGYEPESFRKAVSFINNRYTDFDFIDINMGCPVPKVVRPGAGAALLKESKFRTAKDIVSTVIKNTGLPVSIKIRLGWKTPNFVADKYIKLAADEGCSFITIHCRYADDTYGVKPREIDKVISLVEKTDIPIVYNGGITNYEEAEKYWYDHKFKGVMIGRAVKGNPYCLQPKGGHRIDHTIEERIDAFILLLKVMKDYKASIADIFPHIRLLRGIIPRQELNFKVINMVLNHSIEEIQTCLTEKKSLSSLVPEPSI